MSTITQAERLHWRNERIARIQEDGAIRRVECPFCGAKVGEDCHSPSWYSGDFHRDRKLAAGIR